MLRRYNRVYTPGEQVDGQIIIAGKAGQSHGGIKLTVEGGVSMQLSANSVGLFEAFSSNLKPVTLLSYNKEVLPPGKFTDAQTIIPFNFVLQHTGKWCVKIFPNLLLCARP
jgi:hypothetical protein